MSLFIHSGFNGDSQPSFSLEITVPDGRQNITVKAQIIGTNLTTDGVIIL